MMVRGSLFWLLVAVLAVGCTSTTASRNAGHVFRDCSDCPELVVVVPEPGAPSSLPPAIAVGRYEVTRDEFAVFEKEEGIAPPPCFFRFLPGVYRSSENLTRQNPGFGGYRSSGRDPAVCVSWVEAQAYVEWLSRKTGQEYRLPSDGELQYFERGNATTRYAWGERTADACRFANGLDRTAAAQEWAMNPDPKVRWLLPTASGILNCDDGYAYTAPVGSYEPNVFGLYDTTGNAWEWTADCVTDETQLPEGSYFPICTTRGGSWQSSPVDLSDHGHRKVYSNVHLEDTGVRVVRILPD